MSENKKVKFALGLATVLLIVGVLCYAASGPQIPPGDEPARKVFKGLAGDVMFDHRAHTDYEGDCYACHHHGDADFVACSTCHEKDTPETVPSMCKDCHPVSGDSYTFDEHHLMLEDDPGAFACVDCHQKQEGEDLPVACGDCHDPEDPYYAEAADRIQMTYQKSSDAMHSQCIGCHEDYSAGPIECKECHASK